MKRTKKTTLFRGGVAEYPNPKQLGAYKPGELMIENPETAIFPTAAQLETLRDADEQLAGLMERCEVYFPGRWPQQEEAARVAFAEEPTPAGIDALFDLMTKHDLESPHAKHAAERLQGYVRAAAHKIYLAALPVATLILHWALDLANRELDARREMEEELHRQAAATNGGAYAPSAACQQLAMRALAIHKNIQRAVDDKAWAAGFPPLFSALFGPLDWYLERGEQLAAIKRDFPDDASLTAEIKRLGLDVNAPTLTPASGVSNNVLSTPDAPPMDAELAAAVASGAVTIVAPLYSPAQAPRAGRTREALFPHERNIFQNAPGQERA